MADKLLQYYKYIGEELGISGKIQLATVTKIPSVRAASVPDSAENLEIFRRAVASLTGKPAPRY